MKAISSKDNALYKELRRIQQKGARTGFVLLEGERALRQLNRAGVSFECFVREGAGFEGTILSESLFNSLSATQSPQGVLMKMAIPEEKPFTEGKVLVLDAIMDPGNLGTLLRSAQAFGLDNVLLMEGCVSLYNDKVLRASLGACLALRIREHATVQDVLELKRPLYGAALEGEDFKTVPYPEQTALVIGNEANGIRTELLEKLDHKVTIPMADVAESLNAAVAGSIILEQLMR